MRIKAMREREIERLQQDRLDEENKIKRCEKRIQELGAAIARRREEIQAGYAKCPTCGKEPHVYPKAEAGTH